MKKVIVACGGAVATSTVAASKIKELCKEEGIEVNIVQCRLSEIKSNSDDADLIVPTGKVEKDFGVPVVTGMAFISGVGVEETKQKILNHLK
ncbi:PTS galactitol transporter subunit IIB [Halanaerobaculum tunisiense]